MFTFIFKLAISDVQLYKLQSARLPLTRCEICLRLYHQYGILTGSVSKHHGDSTHTWQTYFSQTIDCYLYSYAASILTHCLYQTDDTIKLFQHVQLIAHDWPLTYLSVTQSSVSELICYLVCYCIYFFKDQVFRSVTQR